MTTEKLDQLTTLMRAQDDLTELQQGMARELAVKTGVMPNVQQYMNAVRYVIGNKPGVITHASWEKIHFLIAGDLEKARAKAVEDFKMA